MSDTFRVGFIGCGRHAGQRIYPSLKPAGLELVAVCDQDEQKLHARADEYSVTHRYTDFKKMCSEQELDAVLNVTRPPGHWAVTKELLKLGYNVWIEKPCAETSEKADDLVQCARDAGRHVQVGFNYRYTSGVQRAVDLIESGQFTEPAIVRVHWWLGETHTFKFMQHYVCHAVDLVHYLTPGGLTHSLDMHIAHQRRDELDWFSVTFRGKTGCIAVVEVAPHMCGYGHWGQVELLGKDGVLSVRDFTALTHYETADWGDFKTPESKPYNGDREWRTEPLLFNRGTIVESWGYQAELERFREAVQGKREPEASVAEAAWGMHVMDEMMKAANYTPTDY